MSPAAEFLLCLGLALGGLALMQWPYGWRHKLGLLIVAGSIGLSGGFVFESIAVGCFVFGMLVLYPVISVFVALRQLRVPRHRNLVDGLPPEGFDQLRSLSLDLVDLGFRQTDQCRLSPSAYNQFYRLFVHQSEPVHAFLSHLGDGEAGFHFVGFTSIDQKGRLWMTWDYPLTYGLKMPPQIAAYRVLHAESVEELYDAHQQFIEINELRDILVHTGDEPDEVRARMDQHLRQQIEYNHGAGILVVDAPRVPADQETFRYSWRGTLFAARQVFLDFVRS